MHVTILHDPHGRDPVAPSVRTYHMRCVLPSMGNDVAEFGTAAVLATLPPDQREGATKELQDAAAGRNKAGKRERKATENAARKLRGNQ